MARESFSDGHEPFESIHGLLLLEVAMYVCSRNSFVHLLRKVYIYPSTYSEGSRYALIYRWRATVFFGMTIMHLIPAVSVDATVPVEDMLGEGDLYRLDDS